MSQKSNPFLRGYWNLKMADVKRLVKPAGRLEPYMERGVSSNFGRVAELRRCGLGAT